jgi:hypothetical protein
MTGNDVDDVDPDLVSIAKKAGDQHFGGCGHPAQASTIKRQLRGFPGRAGLDLDKRQHLAAAGNEIDFPDEGTNALSQDRPAFAAQIPGSERLGLAPTTFRLGASEARLAQRPSSSARS